MTNIMSMAAAERIWKAHREIDVGKKLLADIRETLKHSGEATPIDPRDRHRRGYTLGVPSGHSSERLLDVGHRLAAAVIEAHIADKEKELKEASIAAWVELGGERD